ncbi:MAG: DUF5060 domain-containing protein [Bacillota bacterium]
MNTAQRWLPYEWTLQAAETGVQNPFADVSLKAAVDGPDGYKRFDGFYDGGAVYKVRYMPMREGEYTLTLRSNLPSLDGQTHAFTALPAAEGNHGPVGIDGMHFYHADGERFFVMGTTAYVWHHRPAEVRRQTLHAFQSNGFNKIRMLFFPKHYTGGYNKIDVSYEPPCYPFEGAPRAFDFRRPNPAYFREFEDRLIELRARGIIADVILFHPYDFGHWDIDAGMDEDDALLYLRYIVARLASHPNVWWSLANEYDIQMLPDKKTLEIGMHRRDWDVIGEFVKARDPSHHPISCHNITFGVIYPNRPWMSHVSYQHPDTYTLMMQLQRQYQKPVIDDEYQYEGNTPDSWGSSSGEAVVQKHWRSVMAGGYATHGEAYIKDGNNRDIFWAYGGEMTGESAPRLKYLKDILQTVRYEEMEPDIADSDGHHYYTRMRGSDEYLVYMQYDLPGATLRVGEWRDPAARANRRYRARIYDIWNCRLLTDEILPPNTRLPITKWTVAHLTRAQEQ